MKLIEDDHHVILQILKNIEKAKPIGVRPEFWEKVWSEEDEPPYFNDIVRMDGRFWHAPGYEKQYLAKLRANLFQKYATEYIHEFGCGVGANLIGLEGKCKGYDWSISAVEKLKKKGFDAEVFDMLNPHPVRLNGTLVTIHALEQLGKNWGPFLDFVMQEKPDICVHIEPVVELYEEDNLLDYLAIQYHKKRQYLQGFLDAISGKLVDLYRPRVGGLMHEAYTVMVWKP